MVSNLNARLNSPRRINVKRKRVSSDKLRLIQEDIIELVDGRMGKIWYMGKVQGLGRAEYIGLELASPWKGHHDGVYKSKRYFKCTRGQGVFVKKRDIVDKLYDSKNCKEKWFQARDQFLGKVRSTRRRSSVTVLENRISNPSPRKRDSITKNGRPRNNSYRRKSGEAARRNSGGSSQEEGPYRELILDIIEKYNPAKIDKAEAALKKKRGKWREFYETLCKKYDVSVKSHEYILGESYREKQKRLGRRRRSSGVLAWEHIALATGLEVSPTCRSPPGIANSGNVAMFFMGDPDEEEEDSIETGVILTLPPSIGGEEFSMTLDSEDHDLKQVSPLNPSFIPVLKIASDDEEMSTCSDLETLSNASICNSETDEKRFVTSAQIIQPKLPPYDKRKHSLFELTNGIRCCIIEDFIVEKSTVCFDINLGYSCDPPDLPGMTNFAMKMLCMGCSQHEEPLRTFLKSHGGKLKVQVDSENSYFLITVQTKHVEEVLKRLVAYLMFPIFPIEKMSDVMDSIQHSKTARSKNSNWIAQQVDKHTMPDTVNNERHPFSRFGSGVDNLDIDERILQARCIDFHENFMSAGLCSLVVLSNGSGREMQETIEALMSKFQNKGVPFRQFNPLKKFSPILLKIPMQSSEHLIKLSWALPGVTEISSCAPLSSLAGLLRSTSPNCLISNLIEKNWIPDSNSFKAGLVYRFPSFSVFRIRVSLTDEGWGNYEQVLRSIFSYINLIKSSPKAQIDFYQQIVKLREMRWHNTKRRDMKVTNYVRKITRSLHKLDMDENFLQSLHEVVLNNDPYKSCDYVKYIDSRSVQVQLLSAEVDSNKFTLEPVTHQKISSHQIPSKTLSRWEGNSMKKQFDLPQNNPFLPNDFSLCNIGDEIGASIGNSPDLILLGDGLRVWYKLDRLFLEPKFSFMIKLVSPMLNATPLHQQLSQFYCLFLRDAIADIKNQASVADITVDIAQRNGAVIFEFHGFRQTLPLVIDAILHRMKTLEISEEKFVKFREPALQHWRNEFQQNSTQHARLYLESMLEDTFSTTENVRALETITILDLHYFSQRLFDEMFVEILVHGNILSSDASKLAESVKSTLKCRSLLMQPAMSRCTHIGYGEFSYICNSPTTNDPKTAIVHYLQLGLEDPHLVALANLFLLFAKPMFEKAMANGADPIDNASLELTINLGVLAVEFSVECTESYVQVNRVDEFMCGFCSSELVPHLESMDHFEFVQRKNRMKLTLQQKPVTLSDATKDFWVEVVSGSYQFGKAKRVADALADISQDDLINFIRMHLCARETKSFPPEGTRSSRLRVLVISTSHDVDNTVYQKKIYDCKHFRETKGLYASLNVDFEIFSSTDI